MEFDFRDDTDLSIGVVRGDNISFDLEPAQPGWDYSQEKMRASAFNIISVSAIAEVAKGVTNFAEYELDKPALKARAIYEGENGEESIELHFGKLTSLKDSYYARVAGEDTVYAVSKYTVENLMTTELMYREMNFFPSYLSEDKMTVEAAGFISYVRLRNESTGMDIEITKRTADELEAMPLGSTAYYMTKPVVSECNDAVVDQKIINVASGLNIVGVVADSPEDLSEYGLDKPFDIWLKNTDGEEIHYLVGSFNGTSAYVMVEGTDSVLFAENFASGLTDLNYVDYMFKLVWIHNIDKVKTITFDLKGDKHLLTIRENYKDEEGKQIFDAILDGKPIESTNARRLYTRALNMMISGDLPEPMSVAGKTADYTTIITMTDGTKEELRLYALNERQYAASVNGADPSFFINVSDLRNLEDAFALIAAGEEIPR